MSEIGYIRLGYSSSIVKNYPIFLGEIKNLGLFLALDVVKSPRFLLISGIRRQRKLLDCEHGEKAQNFKQQC